MIDTPLPTEVDYPLPPWRNGGRLWMTYIPTEHRVCVPSDLVLVGGRLVVGLVRYTSGTLCYNEFAVGPLVRSGHRFGVLSKHIWVDDAASLWGGRRLWGIPKKLATFDWTDRTVTVHHAGEHLATIAIDRPSAWASPPLRVPAAGFGQIDATRVYLPGRATARFALTTIDITHWSTRLPALTRFTRLRTLTADPCRFTFPRGRSVGAAS